MNSISKKVYVSPYKDPHELVDILGRKISLDFENVIDKDKLANIINMIGYETISYYIELSVQFPYNKEKDKKYIIAETLYRYIRDYRLREIIFPRCALFETFFKSCLTHHVCFSCRKSKKEEYKHHPYNNPDIYNGKNKNVRNSNKEDFLKFLSINYPLDKNNVDMKPYKDKYNYPPYPPMWEIINILTLGQVIKFYKKLSPYLKKTIAHQFGVDEIVVFMSWLDNINKLRNESAHKGRMFDLKFEKNRRYRDKNIFDSDPCGLTSTLKILEFLIEQRTIISCGEKFFTLPFDDINHLLTDDMDINIKFAEG